MTREEAITRIKDHIEIHRYHERNAVKIFEALDMAIKTLEQSEITYCKDCAFSHRYKDFDGSNWIECRNPNGLNRDVTDDGYCYAGAERRINDCGTEKKQCFDDYENESLIMSDEKCGDCEHKYECRFMQSAMNEVVYGSD